MKVTNLGDEGEQNYDFGRGLLAAFICFGGGSIIMTLRQTTSSVAFVNDMNIDGNPWKSNIISIRGTAVYICPTGFFPRFFFDSGVHRRGMIFFFCHYTCKMLIDLLRCLNVILVEFYCC